MGTNTQNRKYKTFLRIDSYGAIGGAAFVLCLLSGIFLAVPYDPSNAFSSIGKMLLTNPFYNFFRNAHYWSAQLFLIFTLLHFWDHYRNNPMNGMKPAIWFRLSFSLLIIFLVMLSGFILKDDADSRQAFLIFQNLLRSIPWIGDPLNTFLSGSENSLQSTYIHHVATYSIILAVVILEHSRIFWGKRQTVLITSIILFILSLIFSAPFQQYPPSAMKGPWYFIGLQEILHWLSHPGWSILFAIVPLIIIGLSIYQRKTNHRLSEKIILGFFSFYIVLSLVGFFFRGENWEAKWPWDEGGKHFIHKLPDFNPFIMNQSLPDSLLSNYLLLGEKKESCLLCHKQMKGFSASHNPEAIGCTACHAGNAYSANKDRAHNGMFIVPGNMDDASQTCGTKDCHPDIYQRTQKSLMNTLSGLITVDRYVFGETLSPDDTSNVENLTHSAADTHLKNLCVRCHLGNKKNEPAPISQLSRGGACTACHLNYSDPAKQELKKRKQPDWNPILHPSLSLNISNDHCFGCHSRSGRISTSYEGWHEIDPEKEDIKHLEIYRILEDQRSFRPMPADVHYQAGLACIDCHDSFETMGDGQTYTHKEQAVHVACEDCHREDFRETRLYPQLSNEFKKIADLRSYPEMRKYAIGTNSGRALLNVFQNDNGKFVFQDKLNQEEKKLTVPSASCRKGKAHKNLSCTACHSGWAPRCIGCHNEYDPLEPGYDMIKQEKQQGSWVEYTGRSLAMAPTLGVFTTDSSRNIVPAVPGMILSIDKGSFTAGEQTGQALFHRLYAPASPHTIQKEGRSCESCHLNPVTLGYGEGELRFQDNNGKKVWNFYPKYSANPNDGLPEDAWIPFPFGPDKNISKAGKSTRSDFFSFSIAEQNRILRFGACLTCHTQNEPWFLESIEDFNRVLAKRSPKCILPDE